MADTLELCDQYARSFAREASRFDQKGASSFYGGELAYLFRRFVDEEGTLSFDISEAVMHYGIQCNVRVSDSLYARHIRNGSRNPFRNIETLFHAFLYAVDCDRTNARVLDFDVPAPGTAPYRAQASFRGFKDQYIFFTLTEA